jgi:tRNA (adenine37-N6)-methyltransferase
LRPIGVVSAPVRDMAFTDWEGVVSEIHLDPEWTGGLLGLSECSRLTVVFYLSAASFDPERDMVRHPRDRADLPLRGVFATRTQYRPNPIGVTDVDLLGVEGSVLTVKGLDALDGTPVLDIKVSASDVPIAPEERTGRAEEAG